MTVQEAIWKLEREKSWFMADTLNMAISALEKQMPKKPIEKEVVGVSMTGYKYKGQCSKCSLTVSQYLGNYCHHCGQALDLDWSEYNE